MIFDGWLRWLRSLRNGGDMGRRRSRRRRRFGPGDYWRRWTRHRLRRDETRRRLRLCGGCGLRTRGNNRRRGLRRSRRSHRGARRAGRGVARRRSRTRRRNRLSSPLRDRLQHVTGFGDVREIDLGLELIGRTRGSSARAAAAAGLVLGKIFFHALGFIFFDGTGVRFLFSYADLRQNVEDGLALDLEFSCQIVDSNLVQHSALFPPLCPVRVTPA